MEVIRYVRARVREEVFRVREEARARLKVREEAGARDMGNVGLRFVEYIEVRVGGDVVTRVLEELRE